MADTDNDDDPVIATYDVFITPPPAPPSTSFPSTDENAAGSGATPAPETRPPAAADNNHQIYLFQYPNRPRDQPYKHSNGSAPLELRLKPCSGFVELDVPIDTAAHFDRRRAVVWGEALRCAAGGGGGGGGGVGGEGPAGAGQASFGLAAGFSLPLGFNAGAGRPGGRGGGAVGPVGGRGGAAGEVAGDEVNEDMIEELLDNFPAANRQGRVLNRQTLGGQIVTDEPDKPVYMLGAFRGKELHLTKLSGVVQLRPQFHHVDAKAHLDKISATTRNRHAGGEPAAAEPLRSTEPRMMQMSIKQTDPDGASSAATREYLQVAHEEPWQRLAYMDEDTVEAYHMYHEKLFLQDTAKAQRLVSSMTNDEYLDAISAPRHDPSGRVKKKPLTKKQMRAVELEVMSDHEAEGEAQADVMAGAEGETAVDPMEV
ncbi:Sin-like protein conserved region-domain-containing protein [Lineolata rhizophorae]|uniref:Sin-like protein conserved region-domain-containing protein n=1 Tax=Lineolata rhizophorae TaxID=578093 RepID=A0A6A6P4I5_9PEZI|nr:Sin-like protein conserved region-domain-containing protein [Lineolata rhizophorae]